MGVETSGKVKPLSWVEKLAMGVCAIGVQVLIGYGLPLGFSESSWGEGLWIGVKTGIGVFVAVAVFADRFNGTDATRRRMKIIGRSALAIIVVLAVAVTSISAVNAHPPMDVTKRVPDGTEEYQVQVGAKQVFSHYET
jgi:hypothetical protein